MLEVVRSAVKPHFRKGASVLSALTGMMATSVFAEMGAGTSRPREIALLAILLTMTATFGALTVWAAKGEGLRWTLVETALFFVAGVAAMLVIAHFSPGA